MFAYYYLVWSTRHWHDKLGPNFPYSREPLPLPAQLDADGCRARTKFEGNQLIDVPKRLFTQDDPAIIEHDVRNAAAAGLSGFIVNWHGVGKPEQDLDSVFYSIRFEGVADAVRELNREGIPFKLWIQYKASDEVLPSDFILGDFAYLKRRYAGDSAFDTSYTGKPIVIWAGSRKYPVEVIKTVVQKYRRSFTFIGDENWRSWNPERAALFEGGSYYWSSQNPYTNPDSFHQLRVLADSVRSDASTGSREGLWFAPLTPGYNSELGPGTTCVPRNDGETLRLLFQGNARTRPDGWTLISWNEIAEGTYVQPLRRWDDFFLDELRRLLLR